MRIDDGTLFFYLPVFFNNPIILLLIGLLIGLIIMYVINALKAGAHATLPTYTNKMDTLSNMSTQQIISRSRAVLEVARGFNKINELVTSHKPTNTTAVTGVQTAAGQGCRFVMNDNIDFYELIGNWERLKSTVSSIIHKIERDSNSNSITNEEFRRDVMKETSKLKESVNRR